MNQSTVYQFYKYLQCLPTMSNKSGSDRGRKRRKNHGNGFEEWGGYMATKLLKLEGQCKQEACSENSGIFAGIAIFVNGYTEPSAEELKRIMLSNGGTFHHYYSRRRTTHIIASNLPHTKVRRLNTDFIVKASWIVDSLAAGRLLDYTNYLLYTKQSSVQPKIAFSKTNEATGSHSIISNTKSCVNLGEDDIRVQVRTQATEKENEEIEQNINGSSRPEDAELIDARINSDLVNQNSGLFELHVTKNNISNSNKSSTLIQTCSAGGISEEEFANQLSYAASDSPTLSRSCNGTSELMSNSAGANGAFVSKIPDVEEESSDNSYQECEHPYIQEFSTGVTPLPGNHGEANVKEQNPDCVSSPMVVENDISVSNYTSEENLRTSESPMPRGSSEPFVNIARPPQINTTNREYDHPSNTSNPNFLADFYNNSRLHHLSTMATMFKDYVIKLTQKPRDDSGKIMFKKYLLEQKASGELHSPSAATPSLQATPNGRDAFDDSSQVSEAKMPQPSDRIIMHIDMDCFFVSVSLRNRPDLHGKPVVVTHAKGNRANKRPGADIHAEFKLYRERQQTKQRRQNIDDKIANKLGRLYSFETITSNVKNRISEDKNSNNIDEGFDDWDDYSELDEASILKAFEHTEENHLADNQELIDAEKFKAKTDGDETFIKSDKRRTTLLDSSSSLSEIACCSYEARKAGVSNGMFLGAALKLCPDLHTIPYDFEGYKQVSFQLYDIVASYSRSIEAVSCDELYADVSDIIRELRDSHGATPSLLAACIRDHVTRVTKCGCSAGLGSSKLSARLATKLAKPQGHVYLDGVALQHHLKSLPLRDLPGVGRNLSERLREAGAVTCGDLRSWSHGRLSAVCGRRTAATLLSFCNGIDDRPVISHHIRKSVSAEVNYGIRFETEVDARDFLGQLCEEVSQRLRSIDVKGRCISLKLKVRSKEASRETAKFMGHGVCDNITKSVPLTRPTDDAQVLLQETLKLLAQVKVAWCDFRGVGIQVSKLEKNKACAVEDKTAIMRFLVKQKKDDKVTELGVKIDTIGKQDETQRVARPSAKSVINLINNSKNISSGLTESKVLDVDVLLALPSDLRQQIIAEYEQQGYTIPVVANHCRLAPNTLDISEDVRLNTNEIENKISNSGSSQAGPSGYKPENLRTEVEMLDTKIEKTGYRAQSSNVHQSMNGETLMRDVSAAASAGPEVLDDDFSVASDELLNMSPRGPEDERDDENLINQSQIDSSFLQALPEELQEEMKRDYQRQKKVLHGLTSPRKTIGPEAVASTSVRAEISPLRPRGEGQQSGLWSLSPRKAAGKNVASPNKRGRRRGRPPKCDTRRIGSSIQQKSVVRGGMASNEIALLAIPSVCNEASCFGIEGNSSPLLNDESCDSALPVTEGQKPSLCGETDLPSVRNLIKEWLCSTPAPSEEDGQILSTYFCGLAAAKQLEMLDCLLKLLYRKIGCMAAEGAAWRATYRSLVEDLQRVMVREYGAPLQVQLFS